MTDNSPVHPGEAILPRMTADWFNSTLQKPERGKQPGRRTRRIHLEGEMVCPYIGTSSVDRFKAVNILALPNPSYHENRTPILDNEDIDEYNWVVVQEGAEPHPSNGYTTVKAVITGITRAWVTKNNDTDPYVTYNTTTQRLETAAAGKALLLKHEADQPSLISIETYTSLNMNEIIFQIEKESAYEYDTYLKDSIYDSGGDAACANREHDAPQAILAKVIARAPCGALKVPEEDENGRVVVVDRLNKYFYEREAADLAGKIGIATYFSKITDDTDSSDSSDSSGCEWVVTDMDWHRWIQVLEKLKVTKEALIFYRKKAKVWDDCDLDPIVIPIRPCKPQDSP